MLTIYLHLFPQLNSTTNNINCQSSMTAEENFLVTSYLVVQVPKIFYRVVYLIKKKAYLHIFNF